MEQLFYRFRKVDNLIGEYEELERQSIFLAAPKELNDPMEGFSDIYWSGDRIAWVNLFKNYVICLEQVFSGYCMGGETDYVISIDDIIPNFNTDDYPTQIYKDLVDKILEDFFDENVGNLIDKILTRSTNIKRDELYVYLDLIHMHAIEIIRINYEIKGLILKQELQIKSPSSTIKNFIHGGFFESLEALIKQHGEDSAPIMCSISRNTHNQLALIQSYNGNFLNRKNFYFIYHSFTENYLKKLETLCYGDWYTACFMTECKNSSVWGSYGDNHAGVCLIFKPEIDGDKYLLPLRSITGQSQSKGDKFPTAHYESTSFPLDAINYQSEFVSFNFFTSIGRLNVHTLNKMWLSDQNGNRSNCLTEMIEDEKKWREKYWDNFIRKNTTKTIDWAYEKEYRIILNGFFHDYSDVKNRTLNYKFESLHGLIFGINTKEEDKMKIMNIIEKKCRDSGRDSFNFYQAYYSQKDKCINHAPLSLIKFKKTQ